MKTSTKHLIQFFSVVLITFSLNLKGNTQCNTDDFNALRQLYLSTDGDNWTNNTGWALVKDNTTPPATCDLSTMYGVVLDASNDRVEWLDLDNNDLTGDIPGEIGDMIGLQKLHLNINNLTGYIPENLSNLTNILELYINKNELIGPIPPSFGDFPSITNLNLSFNQLSGSLPASLGDLANTLISYRVNDNLLSGCYDPNLLNLNTQGSNIKTSTNNYFTANWNDFINNGDGQCCDIGDFQALRDFYFATDGDNWINNTGWELVRDNNCPPASYDLGTMFGITTESGNVTGINLGGNDLNGILIRELENLSKLKNLYLFSNQIFGIIPPELGNLSDLLHLHLYTNDLTGSIPEELGNLSNLRSLNLFTNQLTGNIPKEIGNLSNLTILSLSFNELTGSVPAEIGNLTNLTTLGFSDNNLSGTIPVEIANLTNLATLTFSFNNFSGKIPAELGTLGNLTFLTLKHNNLTGCYPQQLSLLCNEGFTNADISDGNNLDADWEDFCDNEDGLCPPCSADEFSILRKFYFATDGDNWTDNTGWELVRDNPCPPTSYDLGSMFGITTDATGSVIEIHLGVNNLDGKLIPEIGYLLNLIEIDLPTNKLSGTIPLEIGNLSKLKFFALYFNDLTGSIPEMVGNLIELEYLNLSNNQFSGIIPHAIGNLINLEVLALQNNLLTSTIPPEIGNLSNLNFLLLYNNQLSGKIPLEFGNISNLKTLHLYKNDLTGSIPAELGNLSNLTNLSLYDNDLSGCYHPLLKNLCTQGFTNADISDGTDMNMVSSWEDFCNNDDGNCLDCSTPNSSNPQNLALEALFLQTAGSSWTDNTGWGSNCDPCGYQAGNNPWFGVFCDAQKINVISLVLDNNNLDGSLPAEIGLLSELKSLYLPINPDLEGSLPTEIGDLTNLEFLDLGGDNLSGNLPASIVNLKKLESIQLSSNGITGSLPVNMGDMDSLKILSIENNGLTGSLPTSLGNLPKLEVIDLSHNNLVGDIPREYGFLSNLELLDVQDNQVMSSVCYYPSLLNLCEPTIQGVNRTILVSSTGLPNWTNFCNNQAPICTDCNAPNVYWVGAINNSWSNAKNWDTGCVPTNDQNVWIQTTGKQINVNFGVNAEARRLHIDESNLLFVKINGDLKVGPVQGTVDTALVNYGRINNRGDISFRQVTDVNIYNERVIQNGFTGASSAGTITVDNTNHPGVIGIVNKDSIVNYKTINVISGRRAIQNESEFYNYRDIDITGTNSSAIWNKSGFFESDYDAGIAASINIHDLNTAASNGIYNQADFLNMANLTITNVGASGIELNDPNPYDSQRSEFETNTLSVSDVGKDGFLIGLFTVGRLGATDITNAAEDGIDNNGFYQDRGTSSLITIDDTGGHGLNNKGIYLNTSSTMLINNCDGNGIYNEGEYSLSHNNNTTILDAASGGLNNLGEVSIHNGTMFISGSPYGIQNGEANQTNNIFTLDSQVNIDNCGDHGLLNYAIYNIDVDGNLIITNTTKDPFESTLGSQFECLGLMDASN